MKYTNLQSTIKKFSNSIPYDGLNKSHRASEIIQFLISNFLLNQLKPIL